MKKKVDCGSSSAHFCRHRQFNPNLCVPGSFRTKRIGRYGKNRGVKAVFCRVRGMRGRTRIQTKLYPKRHAKCNVCSR